MSSIGSFLSCLCPECQKGEIYASLMKMNPACQECGYDFQRAEGFYLGAMILSYFTVAGSAVLTVLLLRYFLDELFPWIAILPIWVALVMTIPAFRYSRTGWLYIERAARLKFGNR